ncbi:Uncharacterised protein [Mycobacteroides abscessus subsp. massiliense]|nr:Uncharacterised protein [Mycobacteroides abscessus subsp. massiliense]
MHRERLRTKGCVGTVEARHELPASNYRTAHGRVLSAKGRADRYSCVDCGVTAREWSYIGGAPDEKQQPWVLPHGVPTLVRFSSDPSYYLPRCKGCHNVFDKNQKKSHAYSQA